MDEVEVVVCVVVQFEVHEVMDEAEDELLLVLVLDELQQMDSEKTEQREQTTQGLDEDDILALERLDVIVVILLLPLVIEVLDDVDIVVIFLERLSDMLTDEADEVVKVPLECVEEGLEDVILPLVLVEKMPQLLEAEEVELEIMLVNVLDEMVLMESLQQGIQRLADIISLEVVNTLVGITRFIVSLPTEHWKSIKLLLFKPNR